MRRRKFSREFKLEAVRLLKDRGVVIARAARDLDLHGAVLRKWIRDFGADPNSPLISSVASIEKRALHTCQLNGWAVVFPA